MPCHSYEATVVSASLLALLNSWGSMPTIGMSGDTSDIPGSSSVTSRLQNSLHKFLSTASLVKMSVRRVYIQETKALISLGHLVLVA